jgi:hypothetical protein
MFPFKLKGSYVAHQLHSVRQSPRSHKAERLSDLDSNQMDHESSMLPAPEGPFAGAEIASFDKQGALLAAPKDPQASKPALLLRLSCRQRTV